jgi:hypothetical protein
VLPRSGVPSQARFPPNHWQDRPNRCAARLPGPGREPADATAVPVRRRNASLRRPHAADRFITERAVIVRILDHLGEPGRAPRMAPIRGPPDDGNMTRQDDLWTGRSRHPDRPVDVMPDYEKQNQDLDRQAQTLRTRTDFKAASMTASVHEMARAPGRHPQAGLARVQSAPRGLSGPRTPQQRVPRCADGMGRLRPLRRAVREKWLWTSHPFPLRQRRCRARQSKIVLQHPFARLDAPSTR